MDVEGWLRDLGLGQYEQAFRDNAGEIAGISLQPIPHSVGCILPKQVFLEGLRRICDREGSILIFDDYLWDREKPAHERPEMAVDLFLEMLDGRYELLLKGYQVAVRRPPT